jgi:hypothetical protein
MIKKREMQSRLRLVATALPKRKHKRKSLIHNIQLPLPVCDPSYLVDMKTIPWAGE